MLPGKSHYLGGALALLFTSLPLPVDGISAQANLRELEIQLNSQPDHKIPTPHGLHKQAKTLAVLVNNLEDTAALIENQQQPVEHIFTNNVIYPGWHRRVHGTRA